MENNKEKIFVRQMDRTNPLSNVEGGHNIEVHYRDYIKVYDNVKHPKAYVGVIAQNDKYPILAIFVDGILTKFN